MKRVLSLLVLLQAPLHAQDTLAQEIPVMHQLIGTWEGTGELFGSDAAFSMKWDRVLANTFVRLTFGHRTRGPNGADRTFQALAFYRQVGAGQLEGTWFDSRGVVLPLAGSVEPPTLTTRWGTAATEQGRTVYRLLDEARVEVEDYVLKGDQWHRFGKAVYRRVASDR